VGSLDHANLTALPERERAKMTLDTSGQKCLESSEKFSRLGSWAKTFTALLIGTKGWSLKRCPLIWKMKATKYNRIYYQLCPLEPYTEEIEFGLLPTPESFDWNSARHPELWEQDKKKYAEKGINLHCNLRQRAALKMLPTPTAMDATDATVNMKSSQTKEGSMHSMTLTRMMDKDLLPTPTTRDWKGKQASEYKTDRGEETEFMMESLPGWAEKSTGTTSQLNPLFVAEMMGFPIEWLILPFQDGEKKH
jgi:hypothetical protein